MKEKSNGTNRCVFYDLIQNYTELQYIFEYGFDWDNKLAKLITGRDELEQRLKELNRIFKDSVYPYIKTEYSCKYKENAKSRKRERQIYSTYNYGLQNRQPWYLCVAGACGCEDGYDKSEGGGIAEELERVKRIFLNNNGFDIENWLKNNDMFLDVFQMNKGTFTVRANNWTCDALLNSRVLPDAEAYEDFIEMLRFFSAFAPLSILGGNFLRRTLCTEEQSTKYFFVRNTPLDMGIEQEYIYRCAYAREKGYSVGIRYGEDMGRMKEYIPVKLLYKDRNIDGLKSHLYLIAIPVREQNGHKKPELIPLYTGNPLQVNFSNKIISERALKYEAEEKRHKEKLFETLLSENVYAMTVHIYSNSRTKYLLKRLHCGWKACEAGEGKWINPGAEHYSMASPYYPDDDKWDIFEIKYQISESDLPGFKRYIDSFGDFARVTEGVEAFRNINTLWKAQSECAVHVKRSIYHKDASLLNVYNSQDLIKRAAKSRVLPPRLDELMWIRFIIEKYPNMCRVFLEGSDLNAIRSHIEKEIREVQSSVLMRKKQFSIFDSDFYEMEDRIKDLPKTYVGKYRSLYKRLCHMEETVKKRLVYLEGRGRRDAIIAYAFEYDALKHMVDTEQTPQISLVGYNLQEKRNVSISYPKIKINDEAENNLESFHYYEKLYHIIVYAARCAARGMDKVENRLEQTLNILLPKDKRSPSQYVRLFRKPYKRMQDMGMQGKEAEAAAEKQCKEMFLKEYQDFETALPDLKPYLTLYFGYWKWILTDSSESFTALETINWNYLSLLMKQFKSAAVYTMKKTAEAEKMLAALWDDEAIWQLICGTENGQSEIAFYNENFKNIQVSFTLKNPFSTKEWIDIVRELFGRFICVGERIENEKEQIRFTVTYEAFNYRKIHMGLMVLSEVIEDITPISVREVIEKRKENKNRMK